MPSPAWLNDFGGHLPAIANCVNLEAIRGHPGDPEDACEAGTIMQRVGNGPPAGIRIRFFVIPGARESLVNLDYGNLKH